MLGDGVHHDTECQDVRSHDENGKQQLANPKQFTAKGAQQHFAGISEILDMRIALMELSNDVSGICSKET